MYICAVHIFHFKLEPEEDGSEGVGVEGLMVVEGRVSQMWLLRK